MSPRLYVGQGRPAVPLERVASQQDTFLFLKVPTRRGPGVAARDSAGFIQVYGGAGTSAEPVAQDGGIAGDSPGGFEYAGGCGTQPLSHGGLHIHEDVGEKACGRDAGCTAGTSSAAPVPRQLHLASAPAQLPGGELWALRMAHLMVSAFPGEAGFPAQSLPAVPR